MQLAVDLGQLHRPVVARQHGEGSRAEMFAVERLSVAGDRRDRRRSAAAGDAEALLDVYGIDAGPERDPHLGELSADLGELIGECTLRGVELGGFFQECGAFGVVRGEGFGAVRAPSVAGGMAKRRHAGSRIRLGPGEARERTADPTNRVRQQGVPRHNPCRRFVKRIVDTGTPTRRR